MTPYERRLLTERIGEWWETAKITAAIVITLAAAAYVMFEVVGVTP